MAAPSKRWLELMAFFDELDLEDERLGLELPKYDALEAELDDG